MDRIIYPSQTVDKEAVEQSLNRLFSHLLAYNLKNYNKTPKKETFFGVLL